MPRKQNKYELALVAEWENNWGELAANYPLIPEVLYSDLVSEDDYHSDRKWRFDFRVEGTKLLVELQGYGMGHGGRAQSHRNDITKYRSAVCAGYVVLLLNSKETLERPDIAAEYLEEAILAHV